MRRQREVQSLLLLVVLVAAISAQESRTSATDRQDRTATEALPTILPSVTAAVPLDAVIDEAAYQVGPGDQFAVSIWTIPPQLYPVTVSAQGSLIVPLVGEVRVQGKTLLQVREEVIRTIRKGYRVGEPSVTLVAPRRIVVRVHGAGVNEGTYVASASDRVQSLLSRQDIRRTVVHADPVQGTTEREGAPFLRRSITIFRNSSAPLHVDLERFDITRSSQWSPYLQEGDEVVISFPNPHTPTVTVGGAVLIPGTFEFQPGDQLRDVLAFARGLNHLAQRDSVVVYRASGEVRVVQLSEAPDSEEGGIAMGAGDRVFVPSRGSEVREALVTLEGEARQTGQFPIVAGRSRFSEVITMAGGLTENAMLHAASVYRAAPNRGEATLLHLTAARGNSAVEDTTYVRQENEARMYGERVGGDLVRALAEPSSADNVVLQPGDRIVIPRRSGTVYVFGQVVRPGLVPYVQGATADDYLRIAGGVTDRAKGDDVALIKRATRQWIDPGSGPVEEGDMIWVPREVERDTAYNLGIAAQIAGIISATATVLLLFVQLSK